MLVALAAALSLASSVTIEVPFVPQTDALCGGAAAAMVFRYWGDAHADPQQFAPLIERHRTVSGIADDVLVRAIDSRGWRTERLQPPEPGNDLERLRDRLAVREPVIVLLADRGRQYHYVVVVGATGDGIVVHDPSWGPSRVIKTDRFVELWKPSGHWALLVLPGEDRHSAPKFPAETTGPSPGPPDDGDADPCTRSVAVAVDEVQMRGLVHADEVLEPLRAGCAESPALMRELAGVRFAQKRWSESVELARAALARAPQDVYASEVLGAALFMQDDAIGALRAWNAIRQPRLDLVRISGLSRSRYQAIVEATGLKSGVLLTADSFLQAQHRIAELPDRSSSRVSLRPEDDGFASVDVAIVERSGGLRDYAAWSAVGVRAAVERDIAVTLPGFTGEGDIWSVAWRWWDNRPRLAIGFAAPRVGGMPGVWQVEGSWEAETYAIGTGLLRETRAHGGLTISDWIRHDVRYSIAGGVDSWNTGRRGASIGGTLERRFFADRAGVEASATTWLPVSGRTSTSAFDSVAIRAHARTPSAPRTWAYDVRAGVARVSDAAPFSIWNGAGEGRARPNLLRAHPQLEDGIIDAGASSTFGRTLRYANAEGQRWLSRPAIFRMAAAAFVDVAQASRRASGDTGALQTDIGAGLRIRIPGAEGMLRVDVAHGLRDGANAATIGWTVR